MVLRGFLLFALCGLQEFASSLSPCLALALRGSAPRNCCTVAISPRSRRTSSSAFAAWPRFSLSVLVSSTWVGQPHGIGRRQASAGRSPCQLPRRMSTIRNMPLQRALARLEVVGHKVRPSGRACCSATFGRNRSPAGPRCALVLVQPEEVDELRPARGLAGPRELAPGSRLRLIALDFPALERPAKSHLGTLVRDELGRRIGALYEGCLRVLATWVSPADSVYNSRLLRIGPVMESDRFGVTQQGDAPPSGTVPIRVRLRNRFCIKVRAEARAGK